MTMPEMSASTATRFKVWEYNVWEMTACDVGVHGDLIARMYMAGKSQASTARAIMAEHIAME